MRTAFVFAGGGSLAAAEVGMLRALVTHGERPAFVIGASAGAINTLHYGAHPTLEGIERLASLWATVGQSDVFPTSRVRSVLALLGRRGSLPDPNALKRTLLGGLPVRLLEETVIPVHVMTTDMQSGAEVLISRGSALNALLASSAIPALFPPHDIEGKLLIRWRHFSQRTTCRRYRAWIERNTHHPRPEASP